MAQCRTKDSGQNREHEMRENLRIPLRAGRHFKSTIFSPAERRMRTYESKAMRKQVEEERHWSLAHCCRKVDSTNLGDTVLPPWKVEIDISPLL